MKDRYITDFLADNARNQPSKLAIVYEKEQHTWTELQSAVEAASREIRRLVPTDRQRIVGLLAPNSLQYVVSYLAILHSGHIALPIDPTYKKLEVTSVIDQIRPELIITHKTLATLVSKEYRSISTDTLLQGSHHDKGAPSPLRTSTSSQVATLLFTSGTTGRPKAVPYTHANYVWNITAASEVWNWRNSDTMLLSLPLSHWYGLAMGLHGTLMHGNTLYLQQRFSAEATLERISKGDISIFTHVAPIYAKLLEAAESQNYDLRALRLCISGGAPLPPSVWQAFKDRFGVEIIEAYGSSETGRIASNRLDDRVPGSPGRPLPGVDVGLSKRGELLVKSPGVFPGYWRNAQASRKKRTIDGWWRTGDIVELRDGRIYHKGRTQERIIRSGYSISPRDIEWVLLHETDVVEAHVLGVSSSTTADDSIVYFLVGEVTESEVRDFCRENMPASWRPDRIILTDSLPRTRNGKVSIARLRELLA